MAEYPVAAGDGGVDREGWTQNVVVMRHGDRIDAAEPLWTAHSDRPWDPPLTDAGKIRAWTTGKKLRSIGFPIHRVIVSPFLRCLQTAAEVITALCCVVEGDADLLAVETSDGAIVDPTRVKVHIDYGLCEVLCTEAMRITGPPKDGIWFPDVSELEHVLPAGTIDCSVECINQQELENVSSFHHIIKHRGDQGGDSCKKQHHKVIDAFGIRERDLKLGDLPSWEEPLSAGRERYYTVIQALADKFPNENLLLVTHGEAVGVSVSAYLEDVIVYEVDYCAFTHLQRQVQVEPCQALSAAGFKLLSSSQTGLLYS